MNAVLIGMKYTGKSTLGRELARRRGATFLDTDELMEDIHAEGQGRRTAVRDIFAELGEAYFNELEVQAVARAAERCGAGGEYVVSLGGRCPLNAPAVEIFAMIGPVVYLRNSPEVLLERLARAPRPAFLSAEDAAGEFLKLFQARQGVYEKLADLVVDLDGQEVDRAVDRLVEALAALDAPRE